MKREQHKHLGNPSQRAEVCCLLNLHIRETQTSAGTSWQDFHSLKIQHFTSSFNQIQCMLFNQFIEFPNFRPNSLQCVINYFHSLKTTSPKATKDPRISWKNKVLLSEKMEIISSASWENQILKTPANRTNNHPWKEKKYMLTSA